MARTTRTRSRSETAVGKESTFLNSNNNLITSRSVTLTKISSITDQHGRPVVASPLTSTQYFGIMKCDGEVVNATYRQVLEAYPFNDTSGESLNETALAPPNGWELTLRARTNPSRPVLNPPELLQDLLDIPKMLRNLFRLLTHPRSSFSSRGVANEYLGLQFGWIPLIGDFRILSNLQLYVNKRQRELAELYSGRGARRRLTFDTQTLGATRYWSYSMTGTGVVKTTISIKIEKRSWATVRWFPTGKPKFDPMDIRSIDSTRRLILGLTPEGLASGLWKVLPWTWLIGWFTNIGDLALANSNTVPATAGSCCFMSQVVTTRTIGGYSVSGNAQVKSWSCTGPVVKSYKTRIVSANFTPGFNMPFLDMFRLSILGALAIQRVDWRLLR